MKKRILHKVRIKSLRERINKVEEKKKELKEYIKQLHGRYSRKEISYSFYIETLYKKFGGRDVYEWIEYFEDYIKDCKKRVHKDIKILAIKHVSIISFSLILLASLMKYILAKI